MRNSSDRRHSAVRDLPAGSSSGTKHDLCCVAMKARVERRPFAQFVAKPLPTYGRVRSTATVASRLASASTTCGREEGCVVAGKYFRSASAKARSSLLCQVLVAILRVSDVRGKQLDGCRGAGITPDPGVLRGRGSLVEGGRGAENASVDVGGGGVDRDCGDSRCVRSAVGVHRGRQCAGARRWDRVSGALADAGH